MSESYEYQHPQALDGHAAVFFRIPSSIILDYDIGDKRVTAFSYLSVRRGLDNCLTMSVNDMVRWAGRKPNRNRRGVSDKFARAMDFLAEYGYVEFEGEIGGASRTDVSFNLPKVADECDGGGFATVYLDELLAILRNHGDSKDAFFNNDIVLVVFAYLRMRIYRRRNRMASGEDVEARRRGNPEAYDCYYVDMADALGISERLASKAVATLGDLGLIYSEPLPRTRRDGRWMTGHTVFCNAYKRENGKLLASGSGYYLREAGNKKRKLGIIGKDDETI